MSDDVGAGTQRTSRKARGKMKAKATQSTESFLEQMRRNLKTPLETSYRLDNLLKDNNTEEFEKTIRHFDREFIKEALQEELNWRHEPLLHTTIRKGNFDAARMLLEYGADPNKKANLPRGMTALYLAGEYNRLDIMQLLFEYAVELPTSNEEVERHCYFSLPVMETLVDHGLSLDIHIDVRERPLKMDEWNTVNGLDGQSSLRSLHFLLDAGAAIFADHEFGLNPSFLYFVCSRDLANVALTLIERNLEDVAEWRDMVTPTTVQDPPVVLGKTLLMESHHPQIIKALLDAGVDINAVDEQNCTALVHLVKWRPMLSSSHNMWMMGMIALLEGKPDPFIKTAKGESLRHLLRKYFPNVSRDSTSGMIINRAINHLVTDYCHNRCVSAKGCDAVSSAEYCELVGIL